MVLLGADCIAVSWPSGLGLGRLDRPTQALWRAERKQAVTAASSSRWAGAITRAVEPVPAGDARFGRPA